MILWTSFFVVSFLNTPPYCVFPILGELVKPVVNGCFSMWLLFTRPVPSPGGYSSSGMYTMELGCMTAAASYVVAAAGVSPTTLYMLDI